MYCSGIATVLFSFGASKYDCFVNERSNLDESNEKYKEPRVATYCNNM